MNNNRITSRQVAVLLLGVSVVLYGAEYFIFGRAGDIFAGFLGNLAFVPVYVLFVTLMIERVLKERERLAIRQKLNMVIGVFFSEVGTRLLRDGFLFISGGDRLAALLDITPSWSAGDFRSVSSALARIDLQADSRRGDLQALKKFLLEKRSFMLGLLENPNLLEHDDFTDLLWGVFHLVEELEARTVFTGLPDTDLDHLSGDIRRAYGLLLREWVVYLAHLRTDYPYLFSLAVRTNPFNPDARPEIGEGAP